jgi:hypothetical protein
MPRAGPNMARLTAEPCLSLSPQTKQLGCDFRALASAGRKPFDSSMRKSLNLLISVRGACGLPPVPGRKECREKRSKEREAGAKQVWRCGGQGPQVSARTRKNTGQHAPTDEKNPQLRRVGDWVLVVDGSPLRNFLFAFKRAREY